MKRFGVQLAAGGLVILLGALGVAQAQRDSQKEEPDEWDVQSPPAMSRPVPIAAVDDPAFPSTDAQDPSQAPAFGQPAFQNAAFGFPTPDSQGNGFTAPQPAVRQVAHEDSFAAPPQANDEPRDEASDDAAEGPSAFAWPAGAMAGALADRPANAAATQSPAAYGFADQDAVPAAPVYDNSAALPPYVPTAADSEVPADQPSAADLPMLQFADGPINELRDPSVIAEAPVATPPAALQPYASPDSEPAASAPNGYDEPQYQDGSVATADNPAASFALPPRQPEAAPPQAELTQQPEAFGQIDGRGASYEGIDYAPAVAPAARVASIMPVPLVGLEPAALESVLNEPGDRRLEGMQSPSIIIQKRAPDQVKVGKAAAFVIHVQNVGGVEALGVQVHDRIPSGMRLVDASPQPQQHGDVLVWQLGALEPGGERTVSMQLIPEQEGELGSVARVTFEAAASVRTISTRPALKITQRAPQRVLIGQQLEIELEVSNPGSGAATGVIMQEDVPDGLEHPKGRQLDNLIGTLAPGEVRRQVLRLRAIAPGVIENEIRLIGDDDLAAVDSVSIEVIAPQLAIDLEGPTRRFLERQATYQINVANVGSADATNVEIVAYLDRGFSFVGTEYQGQYDPTRHAVYWSLAELPAEGRGTVPLTLLPIEQGERAIRLEARGDLNLIARHEKRVSVDALAELTFSITDDADPIEVGSTATYEIRITNRGSRDDADVSLKLQLPAGLELVSSDNDASTDGRGLVVFAPQGVIAARSETIHRVRVRGTAPGTHLVKAIVSSRESPVPVTKEESTTVYADQ